jgi:hypothetical protein
MLILPSINDQHFMSSFYYSSILFLYSLIHDPNMPFVYSITLIYSFTIIFYTSLTPLILSVSTSFICHFYSLHYNVSIVVIIHLLKSLTIFNNFIFVVNIAVN